MTYHTPTPPRFDLADRGAGHAPLRRPGSVRRTTSLDSRWPEGPGHDSQMIGRGRDVVTPLAGGAPVEIDRAGFTMAVSPLRQIVALATEPAHPRDQELVGARAGKASRERLLEVMGDVRGGLLFQLIDDFAGASLVAAWVWAHWDTAWLRRVREHRAAPDADFKGPRLGICTGFAEGSTALDALARSTIGEQRRTEVLPLENPADPAGWHAMPIADEPAMRRARRIDLWRDGDTLRVDAGFQDSGNTPDGARVAIHEYRVHAVIDAATMEVRSLQALPLILPFEECPGASINASRMIGERLGDFRQRVIDMLPGTEGCTHLNDVLRALADVPRLAEAIPAE